MNGFRNILSYASKIGFFFGAGTSCAFGLPTIGQLTDEVKKELDSAQLKDFQRAEASIVDLTGKCNITIEDELNYLREIHELTKGRDDYEFKGLSGKQAIILDESICSGVYKCIKNRTELADISELRRFFAWIEAANRDFIKEIYTTNYDMLLEMAMEANRIPYIDGFAGSYEPFFSPESIESFPNENDSTSQWIRLWKIHGSLQWTKKQDAVSKEERIVRFSLTDAPSNRLMIYPSREKYTLSRKEPYIAYFDRFKNYLNHGELVFIVSGYSFGDEHINEIIYNALRNNNRLYVMVFCYDDDQVEAMKTIATSFTNICVTGPKKVIFNGVLKAWEYNDSEDKDIADGMYWDKTEERFLLGDFIKLIGFLVENSGRKNIIEELANAK